VPSMVMMANNNEQVYNILFPSVKSQYFSII